ncbi:MAG: hypothetical protein BalsKO_20300 [Balneolaceae bacterium]
MSIRFNYKLFILVSVPLLNALADLTAHFFGSGFHTGHLRGGIFIAIILFCYTKYQKNIINNLILIFSLFLLILVLLSNNFSKSFDTYLKFATSINMFMVGYVLSSRQEYFIPILKTILFSLLCIISYLGLAQIVPGLGESGYSELKLPSLGEGKGTGVYILNQISYLTILLPIFYYQDKIRKSHKLIFILLTIASAVILILVFRRAALIVFVVGFIIISLFNLKNKKQLRLFLGVTALLVVFSPYLVEQLSDRIQERGGIDEMTDDNYSRAFDIMMAIDASQNRTVVPLFFGEYSKIFAHVRVSWRIIGRKVHNDFAAIFLGSGLIGLFLFVYIHYSILKFNYTIYRRSKDRLKSILMGTIVAFLVATIIQSMANQYWNITSLSTVFFFMGVVTKHNKLTANYSTRVL